ncbi:MAG: CPBP family glutamic-type intramembrane protease [Methanobacteriaceae archaeon]
MTSKLDFFKFENNGLDFPFYNDSTISIYKWIVLAISFLIPLIWTFSSIDLGEYSAIIKLLVIFLVPLLGVGYIANWDFTSICKKIHKKDIKLIILLIIGQLIFSIIFGLLLSKFGVMSNPNPIFNEFSNIFTWIMIPIQLFGEELLKIIPFLIVLFIFTKITNNRKLGVIIGTLVALVIFGLLHMSAYGNLVSILILQGLGSIFCLYGYLKTKNIFVSYAIHIIFDMVAFIPGILKLLVA